MSESKNILKDSIFRFAIMIITHYKYLVETRKEYILSKQLLRSGTSVGAMIREAQNAESKVDFIHKLAIAQKECDETIYCLELLKETNYMELKDFTNANNEASSILKMIKSAILTTKQKSNHP